MADRPIIFSAPMVQAVLAGRKTQTRRVLKPQPVGVNIIGVKWPDGVLDCDGRRLPYAPGDRMWVREAWRMPDGFDRFSPSNAAQAVTEGFLPNVFYEADGAVRSAGAHSGTPGRYRHARFMPRWASRLTLHVSEVRVQRLQEISHQDAIHEGVQCHTCTAMQESACHGRGCPAARATFGTLWTSLHGADAWDANPWVAAITFTVEHRNIDQVRHA